MLIVYQRSRMAKFIIKIPFSMLKRSTYHPFWWLCQHHLHYITFLARLPTMARVRFSPINHMHNRLTL